MGSWIDKFARWLCERGIKRNKEFYKKRRSELCFENKATDDLEMELFAIHETKYFIKNGAFSSVVPWFIAAVIAVVALCGDSKLITSGIILGAGAVVCFVWEVLIRPRAHREIKMMEDVVNNQLKLLKKEEKISKEAPEDKGKTNEDSLKRTKSTGKKKKN